MKRVLKSVPAKIIILGLAIVLVICISAVVLYIVAVPSGTNGYNFWFACVELTDSEIKPLPERVSHRFTIDNNYTPNLFDRAYLARLAIKLESIRYEKTEDVPTDVELFQFDFENYKENYGFSTTKSYVFAYDFYLKKVYTLKDGVWYAVKEDHVFNKFLEYCMNVHYPFSFDEKWRGQSNYNCDSQYTINNQESDLDDLSFRYNLCWSWTDKLKDNEKFKYRDSGFNNTDSVSIITKEEAITRAAKELGFENPIGIAFFDKTSGYWMVELYDDNGYTPSWDTEYVAMLVDEVMTVTMDNNGVTLEIYNSSTSAYQFIKKIGN